MIEKVTQQLFKKKKEKSIRKAIALICTVLMVCLSFFGCTKSSSEDSKSSVKSWGEGEYLCGTDIPEGMYVLIGEKGSQSTIVLTDASTGQVECGDKFENRYYVSIISNEDIKISGCKMYQINDAPPPVLGGNGTILAGMYSCPGDIPAGNYIVTSDPGVSMGSAYFETENDGFSGGFAPVNASFCPDITGTETITVPKGKYLILKSATAILKK